MDWGALGLQSIKRSPRECDQRPRQTTLFVLGYAKQPCTAERHHPPSGKGCFMDIFMKLQGWISSCHLCIQSPKHGNGLMCHHNPSSAACAGTGGPPAAHGPDSAAYTCCCQGPGCHLLKTVLMSPGSLGEGSSSGVDVPQVRLSDPLLALPPMWQGRFPPDSSLFPTARHSEEYTKLRPAVFYTNLM